MDGFECPYKVLSNTTYSKMMEREKDFNPSDHVAFRLASVSDQKCLITISQFSNFDLDL